MPARKSAPKPSKPKTKPTAAPHGPSEGKDKPARRKATAPPAKKAPAKKAAPARKPRGAAASAPKETGKGSLSDGRQPEARKAGAGARVGRAAEAGSIPAPSSPSVAAQLLARKGAPDREQPLNLNEEAFITEYMRNNQNGTAAWMFVHPGSKPETACVMASRLLRKVRVAERIAAEKARLIKRHELSREQLLAEFLAIARADPNELVQMRAVACQHCWGGGERKGLWIEPEPDCEVCGGEGHAVPWIADTRKLSPEARALYAGIQQTKEGIKVLMHDKVAALTAAGRIIGAFERDNEQKAKGTVEALREFFGALHSATAGGLPIVAPGDLPRQQRGPVKT